MFNALEKIIKSPEFLVDLDMMFDTLNELSFLSELLQHRSISIMNADQMIKRTIRRLESLKNNPGNKSLRQNTLQKNYILIRLYLTK